MLLSSAPFPAQRPTLCFAAASLFLAIRGLSSYKLGQTHEYTMTGMGPILGLR